MVLIYAINLRKEWEEKSVAGRESSAKPFTKVIAQVVEVIPVRAAATCSTTVNSKNRIFDVGNVEWTAGGRFCVSQSSNIDDGLLSDVALSNNLAV